MPEVEIIHHEEDPHAKTVRVHMPVDHSEYVEVRLRPDEDEAYYVFEGAMEKEPLKIREKE